MKKLFLTILAITSLTVGSALACTNLIVTRGASADGSNMVSYSADSHQLYGALYKNTAATYPAGTMMAIYEWDTGRYLGEIPQAAQTYNTVGNMNEHQVIIGETTYGGRPELVDPDGRIDYGSLIYIALQRARTAREAILTMVELANTHGYASSGESFSVADKNEAWIFEIIGKGSKIVDGKNVNKGIVWVARRIPDGYISAHANQARIADFPLNDPENCLYAPDVISFAREMGYFEGPDTAFRFCDVYAPLNFGALRGCEARVWSFFNKFADGMDSYLDYAMGHNLNNPMPLWVKPNRPISQKDVFDMMRDHYEGTAMDMTTDIGAGGNKSPYRWRPMEFEVDGQTYVNERAIATQQTGFWFVAQARKDLPDALGGLFWFGVDDAGTSSLTPIYCSTTEVPWCFSEQNGSMMEYSDSSAFWIYNRIAQFAYLNYEYIGTEIRKKADEWEHAQIKATAEFEARMLAVNLVPEAAIAEITRFSTDTAQEMFEQWSKLDKYLMVKFIDGNIKLEDENGFKDNGNGRNIPEFPLQPGYTQKWKEAVVKDHGETLKVW